MLEGEGEQAEPIPPKEVINFKRPVRKWQRRWVLQPNIIDSGGEIWIQKWICVDNLNTVIVPATTKIETIQPAIQAPTLKEGLLNEALLPS
jgi:hypothetical protein